MFKKTLLTICSALFTLLVFAPAVLAAEALPSGDAYNKVFFAVGAMLAAGIGVGLGASVRARASAMLPTAPVWPSVAIPACRARS